MKKYRQLSSVFLLHFINFEFSRLSIIRWKNLIWSEVLSDWVYCKTKESRNSLSLDDSVYFGIRLIMIFLTFFLLFLLFCSVQCLFSFRFSCFDLIRLWPCHTLLLALCYVMTEALLSTKKFFFSSQLFFFFFRLFCVICSAIAAAVCLRAFFPKYDDFNSRMS